MASKIFGVAKWILDADTRKLRRAANEARREVESVGKESEKTAQKTKVSFDSMGQTIDKSTSGVRKFVGALTGAIGAVTGVVAVAGAAVGAVALLTSGWRRHQQQVKLAADEYRAIQSAILETLQATRRGELADRSQIDVLKEMRSASENISIEAKNRLFDTIQILEIETESLRIQQERADSVKALTDQYLSLQQRIAAGNAELSDNPALEMEKNRHLQAMRNIDIEQRASSRDNDDAFDKLIDVEQRVHKQRIANIIEAEKVKQEAQEKRLDDERRAQEEMETKRREAQIKASVEAAQAFANQLNSSTSDFTTRLDTVVREVRNVARVSGRR